MSERGSLEIEEASAGAVGDEHDKAAVGAAAAKSRQVQDNSSSRERTHAWESTENANATGGQLTLTCRDGHRVVVCRRSRGRQSSSERRGPAGLTRGMPLVVEAHAVATECAAVGRKPLARPTSTDRAIGERCCAILCSRVRHSSMASGVQCEYVAYSQVPAGSSLVTHDRRHGECRSRDATVGRTGVATRFSFCALLTRSTTHAHRNR